MQRFFTTVTLAVVAAIFFNFITSPQQQVVQATPLGNPEFGVISDALDEMARDVDGIPFKLDAMKAEIVEAVKTEIAKVKCNCDAKVNAAPSKAVAEVAKKAPSKAVIAEIAKSSIVIPQTSNCPSGQCPNVAPAGPVTNGFYDGTSQWTYPGDIASHLSGKHGQSVAGMSKDQMEALHDSLHNATRTVTRARMVTSGCPGGVCPTGNRSGWYLGKNLGW